jgi:hypothetical protein
VCEYVLVWSAERVAPHLIIPAFAPEVPPSPKWTSSLSSVPAPRIWTVNVTSVSGGALSGMAVTATVGEGVIVVVVVAIDVGALDGALIVLVVGTLDSVLADFPLPHDATVSAAKPTPTTGCPNRLIEAS